jgi:hypothetical protein
VEGDQETKTGQETFSTTSQATLPRNNVKNACAFAEHVANVFPPHAETLIQLLETTYELEPQFNRLKRAEVQEVINSLNPIKSSGYHLITG